MSTDHARPVRGPQRLVRVCALLAGLHAGPPPAPKTKSKRGARAKHTTITAADLLAKAEAESWPNRAVDGHEAWERLAEHGLLPDGWRDDPKRGFVHATPCGVCAGHGRVEGDHATGYVACAVCGGSGDDASGVVVMGEPRTAADAAALASDPWGVQAAEAAARRWFNRLDTARVLWRVEPGDRVVRRWWTNPRRWGEDANGRPVIETTPRTRSAPLAAQVVAVHQIPPLITCVVRGLGAALYVVGAAERAPAAELLATGYSLDDAPGLHNGDAIVLVAPFLG